MWTMPDKVLRVVAGLLAFCVVAGFVLGFAGAPQRGRLPGEAVAGGGSPMAATEAKPFNSEELAPPKPPEPEAEKAEDEEKDEALIPAEKTPPLKLPPVEAAPPPDPVGALIEAAPPPPEDPPF